LEKIVKLNIKALAIFAVAIFLFAAVLYPLFSQPLLEPFTQARLDALNQAGQPVLVVIHADWCSTCKTQERVLQELLPQPEFKRVKMLRVDFDQQRDVVQSFGVQYQSTLIAFKNGREVGRMTAEMSPVKIAELLRLSL
jgi:thioredoxin-like negative regulator of GroEL